MHCYRSFLSIAFMALGLLPLGPAARAAEITALVSVALKNPLEEIAAVFQRKTGDRVAIQSVSPAEAARRVKSGEAFDLVVGNTNALADYKSGGRVGDARLVGTLYVVLAYRRGTAVPDAATMNGLRATLQKAKSIAHSDPAEGGSSTRYFKALVAELDMDRVVAPKTVITPPGEGAVPVEKGEAELAAILASELVGMKQVDWVKLVPSDPRGHTVFAAAVSTLSQQAAPSQAFLDALSSTESVAILKKWGFEQE